MRRAVLMSVACLAVLLVGISVGNCQAPPGTPGADGGQAGPRPGMAPRPGMGMGMPPMGPEAMRMMMRGQQVPAIAVADGFVFVVYGDMLYQFTVDGLREVAKAQLSGPEGQRGDRERRDRRDRRGTRVNPEGAPGGGGAGGVQGEAGGAAGGPGLPNPEP